MPSARRTLALGATLAALLSTAACSKPTPVITLQAGRHAVTAKPQVWCFKTTADVQSCGHRHTPEAVTLPLDGTLTIDVPKDFAKDGWYIRVGNQRSEIKHDLSASFPQRILPLGDGDNGVEVHVLRAGGKTERGAYLVNVRLPKP